MMKRPLPLCRVTDTWVMDEPSVVEGELTDGDILSSLRTSDGKFDRVRYQREYMRKWRAKRRKALED